MKLTDLSEASRPSRQRGDPVTDFKRHVTPAGDLILAHMDLDTIAGCPNIIVRNIDLRDNQLSEKNFAELPSVVGRAVIISGNNFTSLQGINKRLRVAKILIADCNEIKSHALGVFMVDLLEEIKHDVVTTNFNYLPPWARTVNFYLREAKHQGSEQRREMMYECQQKLIELDLEPYAHV